MKNIVPDEVWEWMQVRFMEHFHMDSINFEVQTIKLIIH